MEKLIRIYEGSNPQARIAFLAELCRREPHLISALLEAENGGRNINYDVFKIGGTDPE